MKFRTTLKVGRLVIEIEDEADNQKDFFEKIAPYSSIPVQGPAGFENAPLEFCHRTPKNAKGQTCHYYSVVCRAARQEFQFGILANDSGTLFPKGWNAIQFDVERFDEADPSGERAGEIGEQWCKWCGERPSTAGIPCQACANLGANSRKEEQTATHQQAPAQSQPSNVTSINRPAADVPKINVDQFEKIESLINDLVSLNVSRSSIIEKLHKNFGVTDLRQITSAQADVAIKQLAARIQDIEKAIREKATQRVSA